MIGVKDRGDIVDEVVIKEVGISVAKAGLGAIPFVGTALNEVIFDCGRLKQKRAT